MKRTATLLGVVLLTASIMTGAIACSSDDEDSHSGDEATATAPADTTPAAGAAVTVNLTEYIVSLAPESVPAGPVTFTAKNIGGTVHELVVIKTDLSPESLPTVADGSVDEAGEGVELIGEVEDLASETEGDISVELEAGAYVLLCNVVEESETGGTVVHYAEGMTTAFTVE